MENITITFLGTGNAIPTKKRNHTAIHLALANESILVDCGEGTQRQFRFTEVKPTKLSRLLLTHWHGDHILGLPGLFQTLAMNGYSKTLHIYGPRRTKEKLALIEVLHKDIKISYTASDCQPNIIEDQNKFKITAHEVFHGCPALAYTIELKDQTRIDKAKLKKLKIPHGPHIRQLQLGKDITLDGKKIKSKDLTYIDKGKKVTIILDTEFSPKLVKAAKDSDLLICESTFSKSEEKEAKSHKHLTAEQAAKIAKLSKSKKLILTHISQRYELKLKDLLAEAKKVFKNTEIAKDFDKIEI
tara:strand:+ start:95 stop:994 length:900 start_codon:yes stop_codon:yes gene_type:complete